MSATATKTAPTYLREARIAAGYASRDTASIEVPYSPETIGRHERGDVPVAPEDAMVYARSYGRSDILIRYCADCPVGRATGKQVTDRDLPFATLRLTQRLRKAAKDIAATLEEIADDGIVDEGERPVFNTALASLEELGETITDIVLFAAAHGIEKARPANAEASLQTHQYSITDVPPCQSRNIREEAR
ncbi:hypothetical protein [Desulfitobacterium sp.]|uniref:hypothetical protein n=1 Tax=Desulfitobacterium sp. TaxID=49981 RepID=UPI002B219823|nr:hypothetical protein [Desulfitobacterium sp.]MEA4901891.1 hypothetical protein [Desulfitobacterium sp.]